MRSEKRKIVVVGASRGIGATVARHFVQKGDCVISISRSQAIAGEWIQADISTSEGIKLVADTIDESVLDALKIDSMKLIKRLTLVINNGQIEKVFYPVFPPDKNAEEVIDWLSQNTSKLDR